MKNRLMFKLMIPFISFLLLMFVITYFVYKPLYRKDFLNEQYLSALESKTRLESYVEGLKNTLYIVEAYLQCNPDLNEFGAFITNAKKLNPGYLDLYFTDAVPYSQGGVFINTVGAPPSDFNQTSRDWYVKSVSSGNVEISEPYIHYTLNKLTITFSKSVYTNSSLKGVFAIDFSDVGAISSEINEKLDGEFYIVSENGIFMTHEDKNYILNEANSLFSYDMFSKLKGNLPSHVGDLKIYKKEWYTILKADNAPWYLVFKGSAKSYYTQFNLTMLSIFIFILILIGLELLLVSLIVLPLSSNLYSAIAIMTLMEDGKFDNEFNEQELEKRDESGLLANSVNNMQSVMRNIVVDLKDNIERINASSKKISSGISNLSDRTASQDILVKDITNSVNSLFSCISDNSKNSYEAKSMSSKVTESSKNGVSAVEEISNNMSEISESSKEISNITKLIQSIAFQTNILALNAAVEAARAGEQGRGFAVVASEIRSLAQNVNAAAGNITNIIEKTVSKIEIGDESVKRSLDILLEIEQSARDVSDVLINMYEAASAEEESVKQISMSMNSLSTITNENSVLANESSELGKEILKRVNNLSKELEYFKLKSRKK